MAPATTLRFLLTRRSGTAARSPPGLLGLLRRCRGAPFLRVAPRVPQRRPKSRPDHPSRVLQRARAVLTQGRGPDAARGRPHPGRPRQVSEGVPGRHSCLQRRTQAGANLADPVPRSPNRPPRHGSRVGDGGPGPRLGRLTYECYAAVLTSVSVSVRAASIITVASVPYAVVHAARTSGVNASPSPCSSVQRSASPTVV
jgi:hypothetical protein